MEVIGILLAKSCKKNEYPVLLNLRNHMALYDRAIVVVPKVDRDGTTKAIQGLVRRQGWKNTVQILKVEWNDDSDAAWTYPGQYRDLVALAVKEAKAKPGDWFVKMDADEFLDDFYFDEIRTLMASASTMLAVGCPSVPSVMRFGFYHFIGSLATHAAWHPTCRNGVYKAFMAPTFFPDEHWKNPEDPTQFVSAVHGDGANVLPSANNHHIEAMHVPVFHVGYCMSKENLAKRFAEHKINVLDVDPGQAVQLVENAVGTRVARFPSSELPVLLQKERAHFEKFNCENIEGSPPDYRRGGVSFDP